jgi:PAS domain S-box-containing protein
VTNQVAHPLDSLAKDADRLRALHALNVLDSEPEAAFDALVNAASEVCKTPISLLSLVDRERQWFKARHGLPETTETPRSQAFCAHAILGNDPLEVPNALQDPRFADNPLVLGELGIRFYAGFPLVLSDGWRIGTLCVIDTQARSLDAGQRATMAHLAEVASRMLEMRVDKQRKQAVMDALQRSEARLQAILFHSPLGIFLTDPEGRCTYTNDRWQTIYGLSAQESLGDGWSRVLTGATRVTVLKAWNAAVRDGVPFDLEFNVNEHLPRPRRVHCRTQALLDAQGQLTGYVGMVHDITERVEAQREKRAEHLLLTAAIEALEEGFVIFDPAWRMVMCNQVFRQLYQVSEADFPLGSTYESILQHGLQQGHYPEALGHEDAWLRQRLDLPANGRAAADRLLADGRWLRAVDHRQPDGHVVGVRMDITRLVRARDDAEAGLRAKSTFLANMSHEVRTPLNAVSGMLAAMRQTPLSPTQWSYLTRAESAIRREVALLDDILDMARLESLQINVQLAPIDLEAMLTDLGEVFGLQAAEKSLELVVCTEPGLPEVVVSDGRRLRQTLNCLLSNAVKFTDQGQVKLSLSVKGGALDLQDRIALHLVVEDTGPGIPDSELASVFLPFAQGAQGTRRREGGAGLGLALAQGIVQALGGSISVSSKVGEGSRFEVVVPVQGASRSKAQGPACASVLLLDPSAAVGDAVAAIAHEQHWQLACVRDLVAWVAQDQLPAAKPPTYILCAEQWVTEARAAVAARFATGPVPVWLVLTQPRLAASPSPARELRESNGLHALLKPLTRQRLLAAMTHARSDMAGQLPVAAPYSSPMRKVLQGLRVLVVEDNPDNQFVAAELLGAAGAEVASANNGQEAIERLVQAPVLPDVVLMDMQMPVLDGLEATRRLRAMPALQLLPIVAVTANASAADRRACLDAGMNDHVGKPFDLAHLVMVILDQTRHQPPLPAPEPEGSALPLALAEAHGVDLAGALKRLGHDEELYLEMLDRLIQDLRKLPDQVRQDVSLANSLQASRLFHKLKGSAGTLGVQELYEASAAAERELAVEPSGPAAMVLAERAVAVMLSSLPRLEVLRLRWSEGRPAPDGSAQPQDPLQADSLYELRALLERSDLSALDIGSQLGLSAREEVQPWGSVLDQAIRQLNFPAALQALSGLEAHLGRSGI